MSNISMVSFCADKRDNVSSDKITEISSFKGHDNSKTTQNGSLEHTPNSDEYRHTANKTKHKNKKKKGGIRGMILAFALGSGLTACGNAVYVKTQQPDATASVQYDQETDSLSEIADLYGIDESIIAAYNGISDDTDLSELTELVIPSVYDYIQEEIESKQDKLYSDKLTDEERAEIEQELSALQEKQYLQEQVAAMYTDGEYVYIAVKDIESNEDLPYQSGISLADFNELFEIKEDAVKKYNSLEDCNWIVDENGNGSLDVSTCYIKGGSTIKVKKSDIGDNGIGLFNFIKSDDEEE